MYNAATSEPRQSRSSRRCFTERRGRGEEPRQSSSHRHRSAQLARPPHLHHRRLLLSLLVEERGEEVVVASSARRRSATSRGEEGYGNAATTKTA
nr:hypothetical protein Iba_chr07aCG4340 [Ipomoea batatas]